MAGTVKEAKKVKKKKRLKKSIRKTLGALFMATALVIAAIPVDSMQAAGENIMARAASTAATDSSAQVTTNSNRIPQITSSDTIYTSGDQIYQFAYIQEGDSKVAVITGYAGGQLDGGTLTIPDTVAAYKQYTVAQGTSNGFAAVGQNGCFLFYRERIEESFPATAQQPQIGVYPDYYKETGKTEKDADGVVTAYIYSKENGEYLPCYLANISAWEGYDDRELYYDSTPGIDIGDPSINTDAPDITKYPTEADAPFQRTREHDYQRIRGAKVYYISNQYKDENGQWQRITEATKDKGVFAGATNVSTVKFGKEFKGIGDYAFYGIGLTNLDLEESNGLNTIGKGAFQDCIRLNSVKLFAGSPMSELGEAAFKGCSELTSFTLPWSVGQIGNSAFEDCIKLQTVDLCSDGDNANGTTSSNMLRKIGVFAFKGCELLQSVTLPAGISDELYLSVFEGCKALQFICTRNGSLKFKEDGTGDDGYYTFDKFKADVGEEFYFEGLATSAIHDQARDQCIPFSYLAIDASGNYYRVGQWEITLPDVDGNQGQTNTFVVTSDNVLCSYSHAPESGAVPKTIIIPSKIGPLEINKLGEGVFLNKCNLETVVIPNTVSEIRDRVFQGCHNLKDVIFDSFDGKNVTMGSDAFLTQFVSGSHDSSCGGTIVTPPEKLSITGPISAEFGPYQYAMTEGNYFTSGSQAKQYITYYSGWPRNLEVRYNEETHMSELVDFPAVSELSSSKYSVANGYRYLSIPGKDNEYEVAISNAFTNYQSAGYNLTNLTPNERDIIETALNIVIPEGIQSIKEGLVKEKELKDDAAAPTNPFYKTITAQSLISVTSPQTTEDGKIVDGTGTFAGCKNLTSITLNSVTYEDGTTAGLTEVGDYVFRDCSGLTQMALPATVKEMGIAPFRGCEGLNFVNFQNNPDFVCENAIIYGPAEDGTAKGKLIECLEGRSTPFVGGTELSGITELGQEAFIGTDVVEVDLTDSSVKSIPVRAFADTEKLYKISLPYSIINFDDYAFEGSGVNNFVVRSTSSVMRSGSNAFTGLLTSSEKVIWQAAPDTVAQEIGEIWHFNVMDLDTPVYYKVTFYYWDNEQKKDVQVDAEEQYSSVDDVVFPAQVGDEVEKPLDGETQKAILTEWTFVQSGNTWLFTAQYAKPQWEVTFVDSAQPPHFDPLKIWVANGGSAMNNADVTKLLEDMKSVGITGFRCNDGDLTQVTKNLTATADYGTEHTLTVQGGTMQDGSTTGSFEAGSKIIIIADTPTEGNEFSTWSSLPDLAATNILNKANPQTVFTMPNEDIVVIAEFRNINSGGTDSSRSHTLTVQNGSGSGTYKTGEQVIITANPAPEGQSFKEWSFTPSTAVLLDKDRAETVITMPDSNVTVMANYQNGSGDGNGNGNGTGSGNDPNATPGPSGELHSLVVHNGNNSGSYRAGQQIIVVANDPPAGQEFSSWTVSPAATVVTDKNLSAIVVTMPDNDVALVANYKAIPTGSGNSTGSGNTGTGNTTHRPSGNAPSGGGTVVVVDKNGISNTGVVEGTVNGSSDNFVIRVTENSEATAAVLKALLAEFGNLDNIKYVPMDISLYDSTGTRKITDTTGLSITLTLPLPDSLIPYAGNNRVAGVVNDRLDKLSPRFTTINGVSCIVFTAEHFSPYVIYVDTGNASSSSGTVSDNTPKTGDGIHPKWFLSIGLASLSFVMFMQKDDKKSRKKQKVAVKAR